MPATYSLDDKYLVDRGRVFLSGRQALVRLPLLQRQLDREHGLNTAGFISGYRGSPLGSYDAELWKARRLLEQHDVLFQPGLNEDLAATAVWGTQQIGFLPGRKVDGVFAIWYGKGPGVDRSGDPFKHANLQGTEPHGGILLVFGDDHAGKSSSTAHQSDHALAAHDIPILYPASVAEILEFGLAGFALSRFSGLLVGLKIVNETADATAVVTIDSGSYRFTEPTLESPPGGVHIRKEFLAVQAQDIRLARFKLPRALTFARSNRLDRLRFGAEQPRFLIVTAGKAYLDVRGALELLGIDEDNARRIGLAVYKPAMIHPLEPEALRAAAIAASEVFFVEEKRAHMERQAAGLLFNAPHRPRLSGKRTPGGAQLLPADVPLDPLVVAHALATRLREAVPDIADLLPGFGNRVIEVRRRMECTASTAAVNIARRPAFCAGCPHSASTVVPEGSVGMTGIGCHGMAMFMEDRNPLPLTHMGGEGATWLGMAPFTSTPHVFQNVGDGTYNHSGSLAIRAAVQAKVNLTYKILFNDAVAMTGGQPVEGGLTVGRIAAQVLAEGVSSVVVVSENPQRFRESHELPDGIEARHRDELDAIQRKLRETPGVTVLIYDQTCAAEKRRRRKRGEYPDPAERIFINDRVCEGCGDCSVQSSCLAIQPLETDLGRKRVIDQSACNKDFSCTKGFCPSFVTVQGARLRQSSRGLPSCLAEPLPEPDVPPLRQGFDMLITGVGGTGIVTLSAIVGMAAHIEKHDANLYDMTGLSQKGGAVFSHVRLSAAPGRPVPARIGSLEAHLVLACDAVAATHPEAIRAIDAARTTVILNTDVAATADFHRRPDIDLGIEQLRSALTDASGGRHPRSLPATALAMQLGDAIATNMIMLGFAWQTGSIPLARASIEQAIVLNGVAPELNLRAFTLGRAAALESPDVLLARIGHRQSGVDAPTQDLEAFIARRIGDLTAYQDSAYARCYADLVREARQSEGKLNVGSERLSWVVARAAFKLMAYKDEYEVARLFSDGKFEAALRHEFAGDFRLQFHLAPPLLARRDPRTGRPRKLSLGPWMFPTFRLLARFKWLRGTPFDLFGFSMERRMERELRDNYIALVRDRCLRLTADTYEEAVSLAAAPLQVRGFGVVKAEAADALLTRMKLLRATGAAGASSDGQAQ